MRYNTPIMAIMHEEKAGQWAKQKSNKYFAMTMGVALGVILILGFITGFLWGRFSLVVAAWFSLLVIIAVTVIVRAISKQVERWQKQRILYMRGAQAEAFVAWYLKDLSNDWHVFCNLPCADGGDIDHIVVGPGGLFVLSTKSYKGHVTRAPNGTIKLNGQTMVDAEFEQMPEEGIIAWQLHQGPSMEVTFRDIKFAELKE